MSAVCSNPLKGLVPRSVGSLCTFWRDSFQDGTLRHCDVHSIDEIDVECPHITSQIDATQKQFLFFRPPVTDSDTISPAAPAGEWERKKALGKLLDSGCATAFWHVRWKRPLLMVCRRTAASSICNFAETTSSVTRRPALQTVWGTVAAECRAKWRLRRNHHWPCSLPAAAISAANAAATLFLVNLFICWLFLAEAQMVD